MWKNPEKETPETQLTKYGWRESRMVPLIISDVRPEVGTGIEHNFARGYYYIAEDGYRKWQIEGHTGMWKVVAWFDLPEFEGFDNESV